jgi:Protein of unknown function (DUF1501)
VIFLFLFGGPSQLETFDMKPEAPEKLRGPYRPIDSPTPGQRICEHLPTLAGVSDKSCVVRTMTHDYKDHSGAGHYIQTGKRWHVPIGGGFNPTPRDWPSLGSVVEYVDRGGRGPRGLPGYVVLPNSLGRLQEEGPYRRPGTRGRPRSVRRSGLRRRRRSWATPIRRSPRSTPSGTWTWRSGLCGRLVDPERTR